MIGLKELEMCIWLYFNNYVLKSDYDRIERKMVPQMLTTAV